MSRILLSINQEDNIVPYKFSGTDIEVYTFEEALYYIYKNWKESLGSFLSKRFILWVNDDLDQKLLAAKIAELLKLDSKGERLLKFLSLTDFYSVEELNKLKYEVDVWENQLEWEREGSIGDKLMRNKEPEKAYYHYKKALEGAKKPKLLNNMGICLMQLGRYNEAVYHLTKAYEMDGNDFNIIINYAEALILSGDFEGAFKYLKKAEKDGERAVIDYLYGKLALECGNITEAVNHYERAIKLEPDSFYYYALVAAYTKQRKFSKALEVLERIDTKNKEFFVNQAAVYEALGDNAAAVKSMEKAIFSGDKDKSPELLAILSKYRRKNYELDKAELAASMALYADKDNKHALLEMGKVKKAKGNYKEYQKNLEEILEALKEEYRAMPGLG
ncbi:MAG: tetratricopeptide repeat protein [Defluviitaleaceae bacterium]|nr:tetratricopeptide repeat protein [Defluviitaleaceae bacterium]